MPPRVLGLDTGSSWIVDVLVHTGDKDSQQKRALSPQSVGTR